jgi:hypothetical protein
MHARLVIIFIFLSISFLITACIEAAIFEGHSVRLPAEPASNPEKDANQIASISQAASIQQVNLSQASNTTLAALNVEVTSDVYSEKDRQVLYCPRGNYIIVRNRIYLNGTDLDKVKQVDYLLHPSFSDPVATSDDPTNQFEIWIWSWGGFPIKATITTKTGQVFKKEFDFSFKTKFEDAQSKGIPQAMRCEE